MARVNKDGTVTDDCNLGLNSNKGTKMKLDEQCGRICKAFAAVQDKYNEVLEAFETFKERKRELSELLLRGRKEDAGNYGETYPSREKKQEVLETVRAATDAEIAEAVSRMQPDFGSLSDEPLVVFTGKAIVAEAAKRLRGGAEMPHEA